MKIEELEELYGNVTESIPDPSRPYVPENVTSSILDINGKPRKKCVSCTYMPSNPIWLDTNGRCTICADRVRRLGLTFSCASLDVCANCKFEVASLTANGLCLACSERLGKGDREKAVIGFTPHTEKLPVKDAKYWCIGCNDLTADDNTLLCEKCNESYDEIGAEKPVMKYWCRGCQDTTSVIMGRLCPKCDPPYVRTVTKPVSGGGFMSLKVYSQRPTPSPDARLGACEEC